MARTSRRTPKGAVLHSEERRFRATTDEEAWFDLPGDLCVVAPSVGERLRGEERPALVAHDVWLEVDIGDRWRAALRLMPYAGQPVIAEVRLFPRDDWTTRKPGQWRAEKLGLLAGRISGARTGRRADHPASFTPIRHGITGQLLRQVPLGTHRQFTREFMTEIRKRWAKGGKVYSDGDPAPEPFADFSAPATSTPTRRRASARPDLFYARLASAYVARVEAGSRRPIADVARRRKLSQAQVRDAIHTARERQLLGPVTVQGRPGGQLTQQAEQLLQQGRRGKVKRPRRRRDEG